ncbi:CDP-alcohol phosphatidyltransferase family protein (plasmid) [Nitratireductor rhodophyticola]|uniref:CDP-alcohol phosphatidyltransferase family protein n=1 Tax=Nitratireductor rhodophyticola TaxID=2854036 RepID=UPI000B21CDCC|nr:CDP-alcohol phosphatidyltransferase family protein [Nitratireductor rhodophyticola]MEC9244307.1 CDP-alcohol phosphatidyltransferase family protein [Pseudomonadota bacterium]WPZ16673.1 CDP-alcohol phosphatidyltransferase family protein [Nitratireductor rhodophyticola]
MSETENRRPLASRDTGWAHTVTRWLAATSITPNQISMASMGFAALAGLAFWQTGETDGAARLAFLFLGGLFVQCRLLCNLFDGMVAVEAGKGSPDGAFWNEFPDRVADIAILVGVGYGVGLPALGWAAAGFAVLTAYVRELGRACGREADFSGPMAKPHRMAAITAAAALSLFEPLWSGHGVVLTVALWIVALGAALTALRRSVRLVKALRG